VTSFVEAKVDRARIRWRHRHRRYGWLWCLAVLLVLTDVSLVAAQDLKTLSSTLASRIGASGRRAIAVVDFTDLQGNVTELGRFLAEELSVDLLTNAKGFEVVDRTHLKALLLEHKLASTGLIDPQTARQLGRIAGVDGLVTGTITPFGDTLRLSVKVLDTTTARMIAASTADIPKTKAIEELLGREIVAPPRPGDPPPPPRTVSSMEANDLLFGLNTCSRSGRAVSCTGSITNKADKSRGVKLSFRQTNVIDNLGNQYRLDERQSIFGRQGPYQDLPGHLSVNFRLVVSDVRPEAGKFSIVLGYCLASCGQKVEFRNVPIQAR
jgi:TolB-like protein